MTNRNVRSAWARVTKASGLEGLLIHDLRRSAARDMRQMGVSQTTIMKIAGWNTASMIERYHVDDDADLRRVAELRNQRAQGIEPAHFQPTAPKTGQTSNNSASQGALPN